MVLKQLSTSPYSCLLDLNVVYSVTIEDRTKQKSKHLDFTQITSLIFYSSFKTNIQLFFGKNSVPLQPSRELRYTELALFWATMFVLNFMLFNVLILYLNMVVV